MNEKSYLIEGRLADVLALVNYLSLINNDYASLGEIENNISPKPESNISWIGLCKAHPEFFSYNKDDQLFYLTYRKFNREKLSIDNTLNLVSTAKDLQDKEISRKNRNAHLIPLYIAVVSTLFSAFTIFYSNYSIEKTINNVLDSRDTKTELILNKKIILLQDEIDSLKNN